MKVVEYKTKLALNCIYNGENLKAIELADIILALEPENVKALKLKGSAYYVLGKMEESKRFWKQALKLSPSDKEIPGFLKKIEKFQKERKEFLIIEEK